MKTSFYILSLLLLPLFCFCQYNSKQTDWQKDKLVGKVKWVSTNSYQPKYPYKGRRWQNSLKRYNKVGNLISSRIDAPSLASLDTFKYDTNENLVQSIRHKMYYSSLHYIRDTITDHLIPPATLDEIVNYTYNKEGKLVKEVSKQYTHSVYKDSVINESIFIYNDSRILKEKNTYNDSNIRRTFIYDEKGNMIENNAYKLNRKQVYKYDANGNQTECLIYKRDKLKFKFITIYDDKGNVLETYLYKADGSLKTKQQYKYEYDNFGNWIKKTSSDSVTTRKIEYY